MQEISVQSSVQEHPTILLSLPLKLGAIRKYLEIAMNIALLAITEIILILIGVSLFTGYSVDKRNATRAWSLIDVSSTLISSLIITQVTCSMGPFLLGLKWALGAITLGTVVLNFGGERVTSPVWKYIDGMNLSILTAIALGGIFSA